MVIFANTALSGDSVTVTMERMTSRFDSGQYPERISCNLDYHSAVAKVVVSWNGVKKAYFELGVDNCLLRAS